MNIEHGTLGQALLDRQIFKPNILTFLRLSYKKEHDASAGKP
jgi:hypothetical protein